MGSGCPSAISADDGDVGTETVELEANTGQDERTVVQAGVLGWEVGHCGGPQKRKNTIMQNTGEMERYRRSGEMEGGSGQSGEVKRRGQEEETVEL